MFEAFAGKLDELFKEKLADLVTTIEAGTDSVNEDTLVDALEIARLLGLDMSTEKEIARAKNYVYNLARRQAIPSVKVSHKCIRFDLTRVKAKLEKKAESTHGAPLRKTA
ncbi:MAG: hypothetical protein QOE96_3818 [Blastocatellia bacterium]|nr:hypothetical protein [Blastocatellia bacterium]